MDRQGFTHKGVIHAEDGRRKFFVTVNLEGGKPIELFLHMDESGSTLDGLCDSWAIAVSLALQAGVPWEKVLWRFQHQEFEPKGLTDESKVGMARSVVDYVVRWINEVAVLAALAAPLGERSKV
jgi:ribonucleoside-diphosphate reductase alpha chain